MNKWQKHIERRKVGKAKFPIVEIFWEDAAGKADWAAEVDNDLVSVVALGYLIHDEDEAVTIVALIAEGGMGHGITIPRSWIQEIRYL